MPQNKYERAEFVKGVKDQILSGEYNPLYIEAILKGIEETIKMLRQDPEIRAQVMSEAAKYEKTFKCYNAEFTVSNRKTFDFSTCNDSQWNTYAELEQRNAYFRKDREKFLKSIPETGHVDPNTGELIYPPAYTQTEVLTIKL